jgi:hypothetical protein
MITKQTAYDIWIAYDEIAKGEKLLAEMEEQRQRGDEMNLRDAFGRRRCLQLGVPSGENAHRLLDVQPSLAIEVIKAHIAQKKSELALVNERAKTEVA